MTAPDFDSTPPPSDHQQMMDGIRHLNDRIDHVNKVLSRIEYAAMFTAAVAAAALLRSCGWT